MAFITGPAKSICKDIAVNFLTGITLKILMIMNDLQIFFSTQVASYLTKH